MSDISNAVQLLSPGINQTYFENFISEVSNFITKIDPAHKDYSLDSKKHVLMFDFIASSQNDAVQSNEKSPYSSVQAKIFIQWDQFFDAHLQSIENQTGKGLNLQFHLKNLNTRSFKPFNVIVPISSTQQIPQNIQEFLFVNWNEIFRQYLLYNIQILDNKLKIMKPKVFTRVSKIDRTTAQDLLPMFMNKRIFANYYTLKTKEEIIESEKARLKKDELTVEEERNVLFSAREYKDNKWVIRDYGDYAIGFNVVMSQEFINTLEKTESEYKKELSELLPLPEEKSRIEAILKRIKLYTLSHKLAYLILGEVFGQGTLKDLTIPKEVLVKKLGYTTDEKQIYGDIHDTLVSLRYIDYTVRDYTYSNIEKRKSHKPKSERVGNFIYDLKWDNKYYTMSINEKFVGCISLYIQSDKIDKENRATLFERGYFDYPETILALTKDYTTTAYLLTEFLNREKGNDKLKTNKYKVISYKIEHYISEVNLNYKEKRRNYYEFIKAMKDTEIIEHSDPSVDELENMLPSKAYNQILRIYVLKDITELDQKIQEMIDRKTNS